MLVLSFSLRNVVYFHVIDQDLKSCWYLQCCPHHLKNNTSVSSSCYSKQNSNKNGLENVDGIPCFKITWDSQSGCMHKWEGLWFSPHQTLPLPQVTNTFRVFQLLGMLLFLMWCRNFREGQRTKDDWKTEFSSLKNYLLLGPFGEFLRNKLCFWKARNSPLLKGNIHRISVFWELRGNFSVCRVCPNLQTLYLKLQGADAWGARRARLMRNIRLYQPRVEHLMGSSPKLSSRCKNMKTRPLLAPLFYQRNIFFSHLK